MRGRRDGQRHHPGAVLSPGARPPRLDAHTHVWELARRPQPWIDPRTMGVLHRDHTLAELATEVRRADLAGLLLVQVLNDAEETDDYLWLATDPFVRGVVGWVDLLAVDLEDRLDRLMDHPSGSRLVGVRHQALAEADPAGWLVRAGEDGGLQALGRRDLPFDLMFRPEHLPVVHQMVSRHPGTAFVLDHAGKAPVSAGWQSPEAKDWSTQVGRLAALDNVVGKLSGLTTVADLRRWTVADLQPFVDCLLEAFGPDRLVFGSDWPVSLRAGSYRRTVDAAGGLLAGLSAPERDAVMGGTAARVYRLS